MKLREGNINNFLISTVLFPGSPNTIFLLLGDINQAIVSKVTGWSTIVSCVLLFFLFISLFSNWLWNNHSLQTLQVLGWFSNRTGTGDNDGRARGVWFVLPVPSSSDFPALLPNQPMIAICTRKFSYLICCVRVVNLKTNFGKMVNTIHNWAITKLQVLRRVQGWGKKLLFKYTSLRVRKVFCYFLFLFYSNLWFFVTAGNWETGLFS